jgi:outer membrane protein assembly complex protein YaeT
MRKSWKAVWGPHFILIVLLSLGSLIGEGQAQESETEKLVIGSIRTAGNVSISSTLILSKVRSRVGDLFDADMAAEDAKRIAELAGVRRCWYNWDVDDRKLTFVVEERDIVRSIEFVGNRKYKAKKLRKKLDFQVGDYLDELAAESDRETLVEFYHKKGFAFVRVSYDSEKLGRGEVIYTIDEGPRVKIKSVKFSGNKAIKTNKIKKIVRTRKSKFLVLQNYYIRENIEKEVTRLQNAYYERGFLNINITVKEAYNADSSKVWLTFQINEGAAFTVNKIGIVGNVEYDDEQLLEMLTLEQGKVYNEQRADSDIRGLLKLYRENGFIDVRAEKNRKFISENSVDVEFVVTEGDRFRIGRINITGNEQTQDKVVRRVLDEYDFQPGRWYNRDIARGDGSGELEKEVRRRTVTESATITPSGEVPGQKDAQVNVVEGQTGMVMLGAGVGSDRGAIGQLIFEQRNFDIKDKPESFYEFITGKAFKGAGQNLRIALSPGTEVSEYSISFTEPYFKNKPISLDVGGSSREWERESYDENTLRGYVGFEKRYKNRWRRSIGFRLEDVDVDGIDFDAPKEIKDVKGGNALAGVKLGIGRDVTDDRFNPSTGYRFNVSYEQVGGDHTFGILSGVHRRYRTLYEDLAERKTVLATKLLGATVVVMPRHLRSFMVAARPFTVSEVFILGG